MFTYADNTLGGSNELHKSSLACWYCSRLNVFNVFVWINNLCKSSLTHSVNDLFNGVQTDDAGAFLVSSSISRLALCRGWRVSYCIISTIELQNKHCCCAPIRHPCSMQSTAQTRSICTGEDNGIWIKAVILKCGWMPIHASMHFGVLWTCAWNFIRHTYSCGNV